MTIIGKIKWVIASGLFVLLIIGLVKNNLPRQREAWIYNRQGSLVRHYSLPGDRHDLNRLGRVIGDSGGQAERLFSPRPRNAAVRYVYQWRENGKVTKLTVYDNRELYIDAGLIRTTAKLSHSEYRELTSIK
ncbi:hypothetical protein [uncultured Limosilactobacillus sp.]|uniref:hypothetical protein n=1 Tax=uncultured Limosilactobacillus sp. TaxID=2837629 RepID=UPI0025E02CE7|nr:hypothetical protein [uncultured Limosilactobacillus sp.]